MPPSHLKTNHNLYLLILSLAFTLASSLNISLEDPYVGPHPPFEVTYIKTIRPGISRISVDVLVPQNSPRGNCLQIGAQFITAEGVSQGILPNSLSRVHAMEFNLTNSTSDSENIPAWYYFKIWIASPKSGGLEAIFNCSTSYTAEGTLGYSIDFYETFLDVTAEGELVTLEAVFHEDTYQYNQADDEDNPTIEIASVELDMLPELGEAFWYDPILDSVNEWYLQANYEDRAQEAKIKYLLRVGGNFVLQSAKSFIQTNLSIPFYIEKIFNMYEKVGDDGWTHYKFDMELVGYENAYYHVYRVNCQLKYSKKQDIVELNSWAIQSYTNSYYA